MGWLFTNKGDLSAVDYLKRNALTWNLPADQHPQIVDVVAGLDHAVFAIRFPPAYVATRRALFPQYVPDADGSITGAVVFLLRHVPKARDGYTFGYKDIAETSGPNLNTCSARILEKLSALDPDAAEYAQAWRDRVRTYAAAPKLASLKPGALVTLAQAVRFAGGAELQHFRVTKRGGYTGRRGAKKWNPNAGATLFEANGGLYRLANAHLVGATVA